MASRWILNKKISGSIVSASRHAIRGALLPRFDRLTLHTINRSKYEKENTPVFLINTFLNHKNKTKTGNTSYCRHSSDGFPPLLVLCSAAVPLKNKFASIYGSAGWIESFRCNGVRGVDECGYLCWRHWDAGQGSIRLCRAKPSMWTICRCSTNPHPHQLHPKLSFWTGSTCFPSSLCGVKQKWHVIQMWTEQTPGYISQHALIAGGLSATTAHISVIHCLLPLSDSTQAQQAALAFVLRVVVSR